MYKINKVTRKLRKQMATDFCGRTRRWCIHLKTNTTLKQITTNT